MLRIHYAHPDMAATEIARRLGCHPTTVRRHLWSRPHAGIARVARACPSLTDHQIADRCRVTGSAVSQRLAPSRAAQRRLDRVRRPVDRVSTPGAYTDEDTTVSELRWLARHPAWEGQATFARVTESPLALRWLVQHLEPAVRVDAAANPNCDRLALLTAGRDDHYRVRRAAAGNPNCPPRLLMKLAVDPDPEVVESASAHPRLPAASLVGYARNFDPIYRRLAARHQHAPRWLLAGLAHDTSHNVRRAVAANPSCPPRSLMLLALDKSPEVRKAAGRNPSCPPQVRDRFPR